MKDSISYTAGVGKGAALGGNSKGSIESGFDDVTAKSSLDPWDADYVREDDGGTNSVGDSYAHSKVGACGRPDGNER